MTRFIVSVFLVLFVCSFSYSTNVIIIAVDTLRADHLGCYGYPRNTSPYIDKFAKDSLKFSNCFTPSPKTSPAFASLLSSLPPHKHGSKRNGLSIFDNVEILPEFLKEYGYYSGAFISNYTLKKKLCKLDRGFDSYTEVLSSRRYIGLIKSEGKAPKVNEAVFKWLEQNARKKFFLWVHYSEPHMPYVYHKQYDLGYDRVSPSHYPLGSHFRKIKKYDTEIGYVDFYIEELIKKIKEQGLYEDALIIFMSDHGESFGEHDYCGHGLKLYNSCLHVPLIVKLPGNKNANSVIERNVSILDIAPTVFSQLGHPVPEKMEGENLLSVSSDERVLYFEAYPEYVRIVRGNKFKTKGKPKKYGLLKNSTKLIFDKKYEIYDIEKDRFELRNIYKNPDNKMKVLSDLLQAHIKKVEEFVEFSKKYFKQKSKLSEEDIKKLKALGYIK